MTQGEDMELQTMYHKQLNTEITSENYQDLQRLQDEALIQGDMAIYKETTLIAARYLDSIQEYDEAVKQLKQALAQEKLTDYDLIVPLIDYLVSILLKIEDYQELEQILKYRERFIEQKKSLQLMQKFYFAVCYEGLKENKRAIQALNEVEDTISNNNLVSKYLKLAMLHLQENDVLMAQKMYEYAKNFDRKLKNPMFDLVASDLAYAEKNYEQALEHYQKYFLKAKAKYRYLDRYIYLSIANRDFEEALHFFEEYLPKVERQISKIAKIRFFEAAEKLFSELGDYNRFAETRLKLDQLKETGKPALDLFDDILAIAKCTLPHVSEKGPRDIVMNMLRILDGRLDFKRLFVVFVDENGFKTLTMNKGLLMEKLHPYDVAKGSIIDLLMSSDDEKQLYRQSPDSPLYDYLGERQLLDATLVEAIRLDQPTYPEARIVLCLDSLADFDRSHKLFHVMAVILAQKLRLNTSLTLFSKNLEPFARTLENLEIGLMKMEGERIFFLNEQARSLLGFQTEVGDYKEFQHRIINDKPVYVDDFLAKRRQVLNYRELQDGKRMFEFISWIEEKSLFVAVRAAHKEGAGGDRPDESWAPGMPEARSSVQLSRDLQELGNQSAIVSILIDNYRDLVTVIGNAGVSCLMETLVKMIRDLSRQHLYQTYSLAPDNLVFILKTTDKRIIERIARKIKAADYTDIAFRTPEISVSVIQKNTSQDDAGMIASLIRWTYMKKPDTEGANYLDRLDRKREEYWNSLVPVLDEAIRMNRLSLVYRPIALWETNAYFMLEAKLDQKLHFGNDEDLIQAINLSNLATAYFDSFLKRLKKDMETINKITRKNPLFAIRISKNITKSAHLADRLAKIINKTRIDPQKLVVFIEFADDPGKDMEFSSLLSTAGINVGFSRLLPGIRLTEIEKLDAFAFGEITWSEIGLLDPSLLEVLVKRLENRLIFNHGNEELRRSFLREKGIRLLSGDIYPTITDIENMQNDE